MDPLAVITSKQRTCVKNPTANSKNILTALKERSSATMFPSSRAMRKNNKRRKSQVVVVFLLKMIQKKRPTLCDYEK